MAARASVAPAPARKAARKAPTKTLVVPTDPPTPYDRSRTALVRRARSINRGLAATYPEAHCELDFTTPLELLVATILSAQTTDKRVNLITPTLFRRYPDAAAYAGADRAELEALITPTGFFRAKSDTLIKLGAALVERFDGQVPNRLEDLVTLPGVGRKTANVVLGNAFGIPGITVDTHFNRLARPVRLDGGLRARPDRVRGRHPVREAGLDDAQPPPDLARPAPLPRPQPGLRRVPGRAVVSLVRGGRDRSRQGREVGPRAARMSRIPRALSLSKGCSALIVSVLLLSVLLVGCIGDRPFPTRSGPDPSTSSGTDPRRRRTRGGEEGGRHRRLPTAPTPTVESGPRAACPTLSCPASAGAATCGWPACAAAP